MQNNIAEVNTKHGLFQFCVNDQFIGTALKEYGEFSEIELSIMSKFIKKDDFVFDIGANIGAFTIPFAKKVQKNGKVFTFEPQPNVHNLLKNNVKLNNLDNVELFQKGIGIKNEIIKIDEMDFSSSGNFGGFTLSSKYSNSNCGVINKKKKSVEILKIDDEFLHLKKCNFMKIDVELMEMEVLKGAKKFIKKNKPFLWIENHWNFPNQINKYLFEIGYNPYWSVTRVYNPSNYFINENNIYNKICTVNTLAIPEGIKINHEYYGLTKVIDPNTKPQSQVIESLKYKL